MFRIRTRARLFSNATRRCRKQPGTTSIRHRPLCIYPFQISQHDKLTQILVYIANSRVVHSINLRNTQEQSFAFPTITAKHSRYSPGNLDRQFAIGRGKKKTRPTGLTGLEYLLGKVATKMAESKIRCAVVGAGPVGALAALYAARRGYEVDVYELRGGMSVLNLVAPGFY